MREELIDWHEAPTLPLFPELNSLDLFDFDVRNAEESIGPKP